MLFHPSQARVTSGSPPMRALMQVRNPGRSPRRPAWATNHRMPSTALARNQASFVSSIVFNQEPGCPPAMLPRMRKSRTTFARQQAAQLPIQVR